VSRQWWSGWLRLRVRARSEHPVPAPGNLPARAHRSLFSLSWLVLVLYMAKWICRVVAE
jgi:hypothetical protein